MQCFVRTIATVSFIVLGVVPSFAAATPVTQCGQALVGKGELVGDLDCSGTVGPAVLIQRGSLALNGHVLTTGPNVAIDCTSDCKITGPGVLTGVGSGVVGRRGLTLKDVTITVSGSAVTASGTFDGRGRALIQRCTITDPTNGIQVRVPTKIIDSTVSGVATVGVEASHDPAAQGQPCTSPKLLVKRSSITGSGSYPLCGIERNCPDILTCGKPPRLIATTCETSCAGATGVPCTSWGICAND